MKVSLDQLASVQINNKKPWTKLAWIGQDEKRQILLLDQRRSSTLCLESGKTKKQPKLSALLKNAMCVDVSKDGAYVTGLLQSGNLFVWHTEGNECVWTVEGHSEFTADIARRQSRVFADEGVETILLMVNVRRLFLWERELPDERPNAKQTLLTGSWSTLTTETSVPLPLPDAKDFAICCTHVNDTLHGKQHMGSFVFNHKQNVCVSTYRVKRQHRVDRYGIDWRTTTFSYDVLGNSCVPLNSREAFFARYSTRSSLMALAVNQRNPLSSCLVFLDSVGKGIVVVDLHGCGTKETKPNQRKHYVADVAWTTDDSFVACVTRDGNFFLATRLGELLFLSRDKNNVQRNHFLSIKIDESRSNNVENDDDNRSTSISSSQTTKRRHMIASHPRKSMIVFTDGLLVVSFALPQALQTPSNVLEYLIAECNISHPIQETASDKDADAPEEENLSYSALTSSESIRAAKTNVTSLLSLSSMGLSEAEIAFRSLLSALGFCVSTASYWSQTWEKLSQLVIDRLILITSNLPGKKSATEKSWQQRLHLNRLILSSCFKLLRFDWHRQNLFGVKLYVAVMKNVLETTSRWPKHKLRCLEDVATMIVDAESTLCPMYCFESCSTSSFPYIVEGCGISDRVEFNGCDDVPRESKKPDGAISKKFTGLWKTLYKDALNQFVTVNEQNATEAAEDFISLICKVQQKLQALGEKLVFKPGFKIGKGTNEYLMGNYFDAWTTWKFKATKILGTDDDDMDNVKGRHLTEKDGSKLEHYLHAVLYGLLASYKLTATFEFVNLFLEPYLARDKDSRYGPNARKSVKSLFLSLARFMSRYFTNRMLVIYPPYMPKPLPRSTVKQVCDGLVLSRERVQSTLTNEAIDHIWIPETVASLFLICGSIAEVVEFSYALGDLKTSFLLSVATSETIRFGETVSPTNLTMLPKYLCPSSIMTEKIMNLLGINDKSNSNDDKVEIVPKITIQKQVNLSGELCQKLTKILVAHLRTAILCKCNITSSLICSFVERMFDLVRELPFQVQNQFSLPAPPVYCPQDNTASYLTDAKFEAKKRDEISHLIQLLLILFKASGTLIPIAHWYADFVADGDLGLILEKPFQNYGDLGISKSIAEDANDDMSSLKTSFRKFCLLIWILEVRDNLHVEQRKLWSALETLRPFTTLDKYAKQCISVLKWCQRLQPFAESFNWQRELYQLILSVAMETPPSVKVADLVSNCYLTEEQVPADLQRKFKLLLKAWERVTFVVKSAMPDKSATPPQKVLSNYFLERCNDVIKNDKDEMSLLNLSNVHVTSFEKDQCFLEFLIVLLDVSVHKDVDDYVSIYPPCPLILANTDKLQSQEHMTLRDCTFLSETLSNSANAGHLLQAAKSMELLNVGTQRGRLTQSASDTDLSKSQSESLQVQPHCRSFENLRVPTAKVPLNQNPKEVPVVIRFALNDLLSDETAVLIGFEELTSRYCHEFSLRNIVALDSWSRRIHPMGLQKSYERKAQIRLQVPRLHVLYGILSACRDMTDEQEQVSHSKEITATENIAEVTGELQESESQSQKNKPGDVQDVKKLCTMKSFLKVIAKVEMQMLTERKAKKVTDFDISEGVSEYKQIKQQRLKMKSIRKKPKEKIANEESEELKLECSGIALKKEFSLLQKVADKSEYSAKENVDTLTYTLKQPLKMKQPMESVVVKKSPDDKSKLGDFSINDQRTGSQGTNSKNAPNAPDETYSISGDKEFTDDAEQSMTETVSRIFDFAQFRSGISLARRTDSLNATYASSEDRTSRFSKVEEALEVEDLDAYDKFPDDTLNDISSPESVEVFTEVDNPKVKDGNGKQVRFADVQKSYEPVSTRDQGTDIPRFLRLTAEREEDSNVSEISNTEESQASKHRLRGGGGKTVQQLPLLQLPLTTNNRQSAFKTYCAQPRTNLIQVKPVVVPRALPLLRLPAKYCLPETKPRCAQVCVDSTPCSHTLYVQDMLRRYWQGIQEARSMTTYSIQPPEPQPNCSYYIPNADLNDLLTSRDPALRTITSNVQPTCQCRPCPYTAPNTDMGNGVTSMLNNVATSNLAAPMFTYGDVSTPVCIPNVVTPFTYDVSPQNVQTPLSIPLISVPVPVLVTPPIQENYQPCAWLDQPSTSSNARIENTNANGKLSQQPTPMSLSNNCEQFSQHTPTPLNGNFSQPASQMRSPSHSFREQLPTKNNTPSASTFPYSVSEGSQTSRVNGTMSNGMTRPTTHQSVALGTCDFFGRNEAATSIDDLYVGKEKTSLSTQTVSMSKSASAATTSVAATNIPSSDSNLRKVPRCESWQVATSNSQGSPKPHSALRCAYYGINYQDKGEHKPSAPRIQVPVCTSRDEVERFISQTLLTVPTCTSNGRITDVTVPTCKDLPRVLPCESTMSQFNDQNNKPGTNGSRNVVFPCQPSIAHFQNDHRSSNVVPVCNDVIPCRSKAETVPVCVSQEQLSEGSAGEVSKRTLSANTVPTCRSLRILPKEMLSTMSMNTVKICESKTVPSCKSVVFQERTVVPCRSSGWNSPVLVSTSSHESVIHSQKAEADAIPHCQHFHGRLQVPACTESTPSKPEPTVPTCEQVSRRNRRWDDSHEQMLRQHGIQGANSTEFSSVCPSTGEPGQVFKIIQPTVPECRDEASQAQELHDKVLEELEKQRSILEDLCRKKDPCNHVRPCPGEVVRVCSELDSPKKRQPECVPVCPESCHDMYGRPPRDMRLLNTADEPSVYADDHYYVERDHYGRLVDRRLSEHERELILTPPDPMLYGRVSDNGHYRERTPSPDPRELFYYGRPGTILYEDFDYSDAPLQNPKNNQRENREKKIRRKPTAPQVAKHVPVRVSYPPHTLCKENNPPPNLGIGGHKRRFPSWEQPTSPANRRTPLRLNLNCLPPPPKRRNFSEIISKGRVPKVVVRPHPKVNYKDYDYQKHPLLKRKIERMLSSPQKTPSSLSSRSLNNGGMQSPTRLSSAPSNMQDSKSRDDERMRQYPSDDYPILGYEEDNNRTLEFVYSNEGNYDYSQIAASPSREQERYYEIYEKVPLMDHSSEQMIRSPQKKFPAREVPVSYRPKIPNEPSLDTWYKESNVQTEQPYVVEKPIYGKMLKEAQTPSVMQVLPQEPLYGKSSLTSQMEEMNESRNNIPSLYGRKYETQQPSPPPTAAFEMAEPTEGGTTLMHPSASGMTMPFGSYHDLTHPANVRNEILRKEDQDYLHSIFETAVNGARMNAPDPALCDEMLNRKDFFLGMFERWLVEELTNGNRRLESMQDSTQNNGLPPHERETSGQDRYTPTEDKTLPNAKDEHQNHHDVTSGNHETSTFVNTVTFTESYANGRGLLQAGNPGNVTRGGQTIASQAAVFSRIHEQIEATIKFCIEAESVKEKIETELKNMPHGVQLSTLANADYATRESKFLQEFDKIINERSEDDPHAQFSFTNPRQDSTEMRILAQHETPNDDNSIQSVQGSRSTSPVKKKSSSVTFDTVNQQRNPSRLSTNSYETSRPSDHDAVSLGTPTRRWDALQHTIKNARIEMTKEHPVMASTTTKNKDRALVRQMQTNSNFKLRLQEACTLMEDIMSARPNVQSRQTSSVAPTSPRLSAGRSRTTVREDTWSSTLSPLKTMSSSRYRHERVSNLHTRHSAPSPRARMSYPAIGRRNNVQRQRPVNNAQVPKPKMASQRLARGGRRRNFIADNVASTIPELSENGNLSSDNVKSVSSGRGMRNGRRLVVKMTRATILRKRLAQVQLGKVNAKDHPQKKSVKTNKKPNEMLLRKLNVNNKPLGRSSYTERLRTLQQTKPADSPTTSHFSEVSNPSMWEIPEVVKTILYKQEDQEVDMDTDVDEDGFESYSEEDVED